MTTAGDSGLGWERIVEHLPAGFAALAERMGLLRERPAHMGTKIRDISVALRLVLHQAGTSSSLRATTAQAAATGVVSMSAVSLHQWMKKLGPYLTALLSQMVSTASFAPALCGGFHVIAGDATTVQRPGSKGTTARVHYALRLSDLTPQHIEVTDEHGGETARRFRAQQGELWLLDRGYANPPGVGAICERGGHIIVRHNRGTLPLYDGQGKRLDIMALLHDTNEREHARERRAFVHLGAQRIAGRVCWLRVPQDKADAARQRVQREADNVCDEDTLHAAEFVVVFTTVLQELTATQVLHLYRARWQVELAFKRAKSIGELDRLPNFLPETIHSWICAKLILQIIATRIASPSEAFPPSATRFALFDRPKAGPTTHRARGRRAMVRHEVGMATGVCGFATG
jgi:hypothetical protein